MLVAIHQPNFAPSLSLFAKWRQADALVLLDGVQYVRHGRHDHYLNRCMLANGWCTIPVLHGRPDQKIRDVQIAPCWAPGALYKRICRDYAQAPYGKWAAELAVESVLSLFHHRLWRAVNMPLLLEIGDLLGIKAPLYTQEELGVDDTDRDWRLIKLVKAAGGDSYLSGPKGPEYMRPSPWNAMNISVKVSRFHWPQYPRGGLPWQIGLSIIDALAWLGPDGVAELIQDAEVEDWKQLSSAVALP